MKPAICFGFLLTALVAIVPGAHAQPPQKQPRPIRMNHLAFQVSNLQKSTEFYMHIIGLDSLPEPFRDGRHIWLSLGNTSHLHLIYKPDSSPIIPAKNTHLCLSVASVPLFLKVLEQEKIKWEDWPGTPMATTTRVDGVHQVYLQDPDGYWLEINDATE